MRNVLIGLVSVLILYKCADTAPEKAQQAIDQAIKAHGGHHYKGTEVTFRFRDKDYSVTRRSDGYSYTRSFTEDLDTITDVLNNSSEFFRLVNGDTADLADTTKTKYANSVNSVLYFVQLPYLLNDPAVNKKYQGTATIEGNPYDVVKVTFDAQKGGQDHEDEYLYWINQKTHMLDYFAYNYQTDGGGVRFRKAYNRMERGGIVFQDYVNYEAPIGTPLNKLPQLMEQGQLNELSRIENEDINVQNL